jgi:hypothetical protein
LERLYSKVDVENFWTDFGLNIRDNDGAKHVGILSLSVALGVFGRSYSRLAELMPAVLALCESLNVPVH